MIERRPSCDQIIAAALPDRTLSALSTLILAMTIIRLLISL